MARSLPRNSPARKRLLPKASAAFADLGDLSRSIHAHNLAFPECASGAQMPTTRWLAAVAPATWPTPSYQQRLGQEEPQGEALVRRSVWDPN